MATTAIRMDTTDALLPLALRLSALEVAARGFEPPKSGQGALRRIQDAQERFDQLARDSDALKRLFDGYESYKHLLATEEGKDDGADVPDNVMLSVLLESRVDIVELERDLREVEVLQNKDVHGSGDLEQILPLSHDIADRLTQSEGKKRDVKAAQTEVLALIKRYSEFSSAVSDLFLNVHHRLENLEEQVRRIERAKRQEVAARY